MITGTFPGVKRPGRGVDHTSSSSAEVTPPLGLHGLFYGELFTFTKRYQTKVFIVASKLLPNSSSNSVQSALNNTPFLIYQFQCFTVHFSIQQLINTNTCTFPHSKLY